MNERGLLKTDEKGETTMEGIFASGDVVTGAKTVVEAVKRSRMIADAMDEYVKNKKKKNKISITYIFCNIYKKEIEISVKLPYLQTTALPILFI